MRKHARPETTRQADPVSRDFHIGNPIGAFSIPPPAPFVQNHLPTPPAAPSSSTTVLASTTAPSSERVSRARGQTNRRAILKQRKYTELEDRFIADSYEQGTQAGETKKSIQERVSAFLSGRGAPVSANSVLGRYQRMAKRQKDAKFPEKINGEYLTPAHRVQLGLVPAPGVGSTSN